MANFGEMQTYISKRLLDPNNQAVTIEEIKEAINESISYWKFKRFWFNEAADMATMTSGSASFPYPADFLIPAKDTGAFYIEYGETRYPLKKISAIDYDCLFLENGFGLPRFYAKLGSEQYQCYPIPDQDYVVGRRYLKNYDDLVNDTDTNDFTEYASRLINTWALSRLHLELRQDREMSSSFAQIARDEFKNLLLRTNKENATGTLSVGGL